MSAGDVNGRSDAERLRSAEVDLDAVHANVLSAIARERGIAAWLRGLSTRKRTAMAWAGVAVMFIAPLIIAPLTFTRSKYALPRWGIASGAAAIATAAVLAALIRSALRPLQEPARRMRDAILLGAAILLPFALVLARPGTAAKPVHEHNTCFFIATCVAWLLLLLMRALDRRVHGDLRIAALGLAVAGLAANLALHVECPWTGFVHRMSCHATVGFALALQYLVFRFFFRRK